VPEITACAKLAASGHRAELNFVPHSGPFARGIHVTVQAS
jgi:N-acetyl-gamma-glutamylphosphate reductase